MPENGSESLVYLHGERAVHAAIYGGHADALRVLLQAGANPNSTDSFGMTPLMAAWSNCYGNVST